MAKSQRVLHNTEVFKQIISIETEYFHKIRNELFEFLKISNNSKDINLTTGVMSLISTKLISYNNPIKYCDSYDRIYYTDISLVESVLKSSNAWHYIEPTYREGYKKITTLAKQMKHPK